jgi:iron-sulfur cluster assembly protein
MLTLTPTASEAIRQLSAQTDGADDGGIRISPGPETPEGTALELELVSHGEPDDTAVDDDGATVYMEPHVAAALDTMVLDAAVEEGRVTFAIREPGPSPNGAGPA